MIQPDEFVMLVIAASGGQIRGKTLLQKRCYFLSHFMDYNLGYRAHYYGPYSPEVDDALGRVKALGFVDEHSEGFGIMNAVGFEVRRYDYRINNDGSIIAEDLKNKYPAEWSQIQVHLQRMKNAGDDGNYVSLSIAAKVHYVLLTQNQPMTPPKIKEVAEKFGWEIDDKMIDKAASFLEKLDLVKNSEPSPPHPL
ncbi:MAG TPA: hypothetical protein PLQ35_10685 [bacterium]|nr:hypothetical protein [bacterium]HQL62749.1 hypothetical protein [bacterium]